MLDITQGPTFDETIWEKEYHTHNPYASSKLNNNDEIRIPIQQQDIYTQNTWTTLQEAILSPPLLTFLAWCTTSDRTPLDPPEAGKLHLCPFSQPLETDSQTTQFILQPHSGRVVCLLVQDLVDISLDLRCLLRGIRSERLRHKFHVERGLHELRERN